VRARLPGGPLRTLLGAWLLLGAGGWAFTVAIAVHAYNAGGTGSVAAVAAARLLPGVITAPLSGRLVDRGDRARVAAVAAVLQAACLAGAAVLVLSDAPLAGLVVLAGAVSATATAPRPALQALMPALAGTPGDLTRATAAWAALDSLGFLVGSGIGGVAIAATGPGAVVAGSAVLVAAAALLAARLPSTEATAADEPAGEEGMLESALGGLRALRDAPPLRVPFALFAGLLLLEGATDVQLVVLALDDLSMGDGGPGALFTFWGVGGIFGSLLVLVLLRRRGYGLALWAGALAFGAALAVAGADGVAVALAAMIPVGAGYALIETAVMALVPRLADDAVVGRVYALSELLYAGAAGIGALVAPLLVDSLGAGGSLAAAGGAYALVGLLAWRALTTLDAGQEEAGRVRELLRGLPFLAPLPLPRLERLVRGARPVALPAGSVVVAQGDPGEDFFVIEEGTVDVVEYGREQGPGEGFGEIALLRDVPRTATVRAATDVRLRALTRPAFLAAVSGHRDARAAADEVAAERLAQSRPS
jgi:MFS family permease